MTVLVAGIGNVFFGDDGFGVEVAHRLVARDRPPPAGVRIAEYGIRGLHLAFDVLDGVATLVLVDALPMGEPPGTVVVLEVDPDDIETDEGGPTIDAHSMSPAAVLASIANLGGRVDRVYVVGCEPLTIEDGMGLSDVVRDAVPAAVAAVDELVADLAARAERNGHGDDPSFVDVGGARAGGGLGGPVVAGPRPLPQDQGDVTWQQLV